MTSIAPAKPSHALLDDTLECDYNPEMPYEYNLPFYHRQGRFCEAFLKLVFKNVIDLNEYMTFCRHSVDGWNEIEGLVERDYSYVKEVILATRSYSSALQEIDRCESLEDLMEVSLSHGLYFLFKYLYMAKKVPLKLKAYNQHFPKGSLVSQQPGVSQAEMRTQSGVCEKLRVFTEGSANAGMNRISKLFENGLKSCSSYNTMLYSGTGWVFKGEAKLGGLIEAPKSYYNPEHYFPTTTREK